MTCLPGRPGLTLPQEGLGKRTVVGEDMEDAAGKQVAEVADAEVDCSQLVVEGGVLGLFGRQLSRTEL